MSPPHNLSAFAAIYYWHQSQQEEPPPPIYTCAKRVAFKQPNRWEPWNDNQTPPIQFLEFFQMMLADFQWLSDELRNKLQHDPLCRGNPLRVEAQVAVGIYLLVHGVCYVTIGHIFNIGKEAAKKVAGRFVNAVLKNLRLQAVRYASEVTLLNNCAILTHWLFLAVRMTTRPRLALTQSCRTYVSLPPVPDIIRRN
jgi:hypothetical protein